MSRLKYLIVTCVLAATVAAANATTFDVIGTFNSGQNLSGTMDVTNGAVISADLQHAGVDFSVIVNSFPYDGLNWGLMVADPNDLLHIVYFLFTTSNFGLLNGFVVGSLDGFSGGHMWVGYDELVVPPTILDTLISGDPANFVYPGLITLAATTATPLPSTWLMLLSGFVGLGFFAYRGTKKNSASLAAA